MRVTVHVSKCYDWAPVPLDVKVTPKDVASGRVRPAANGGHLMKVTREFDTHVDCQISEGTIIARIIHEMMPQQGCIQLTRKEAVGNMLAQNLLPHHAHPTHIRSFEVHDDGPDEKLFRASIAPYVVAIHDASGLPLIPPSDVETLVAKYLTPSTHQDRVDHLHAKFNVKPAAAKVTQ